jgi:hypothetical protein
MTAIGDRARLVQAAIARRFPASVTSVGGRTGAVTLSHSDISGLGSAALAATTDFDAAAAASAAQAAAEAASDPAGAATAAQAASDPAGSAAAAQAAAEAYAHAGDAPTIDATITTHDATANVVVATYTPAHNTLVQVEAAFVGRQQDGSNAKGRKATASFLTDGSGVVTQVGSTALGATQSTGGATAWAQNILTDGTVVQIVVTGAAATDIDWHVAGDVMAAP